MTKRLLIISSNTIHVLNYINLTRDYFDDIHLITNTVEERFDYKDIKISYTEFSIRKPIAFYKSIRFIKKTIQEYDPTVIHCQQITTNSLQTLLANKKLRKPIVFTAWGSDILTNPNQGFWLAKMVKYILKHGQNFTSDSKYMAEVMDQMAGKKLNTLIANFGINIDKSSITEKQNVIYSNRQLKKLYRIDKIIEAFAKFIQKGDRNTWKLIIGAEGEDKQALMKLATELNIDQQVEFVGWLQKEQNSHYYNIAKYYVSVPESDATSISLLEAMAAGCVPILSDLPANREWIDHRKNGIIVNDLNQNFIEEALQIDFEKAQQMNQEIIENHGTKAANRKKFITFYEQIMPKQQ